jgi:foldase protein PrsA
MVGACAPAHPPSAAAGGGSGGGEDGRATAVAVDGARRVPLAAQATADGSVVPTTAPDSVAADAVIAVVNGKPIAREQLVRPLIDSYGLNMLLNLITLELARQDAAKAGLAISAADVRNERTIMLKGVFPDAEPADYDQLLVQLLKQQNITDAQFQILLETNAYLRKVAEPLCAGKISEENIQQAFDLRYGATVKIRDIKVNNLAEANEAKRRLAGGEDFAEVARALSRDPQTGALGGEWPAFAASSTRVSDVIKEQAFGLKVGEVSDVLNTEGAYHIIKVEQRNPPRIAKLDDEKRTYLRNLLMEKLVQDVMKNLRNQLAAQALAPNVLDIRDPELRRQFEQRLAEHKAVQQDEEAARREAAIRRIFPATRLSPTTRPGFAPATLPAAPTTLPAEAPQRPPATQSGAAPAK